MGGEPTFRLDGRSGTLPEWNSDALGPKKLRARADKLIRRLRDPLRPRRVPPPMGRANGIPGESLPRWDPWACTGGRDGKPIWLEPKLVADETRAQQTRPSTTPMSLFTHLARPAWGSGRSTSSPALKMSGITCGKERRLPGQCRSVRQQAVQQGKIATGLAKVFEQGLNKVIGFCLPLRAEVQTADGDRGVGFRRARGSSVAERMYLVPGDSPMGVPAAARLDFRGCRLRIFRTSTPGGDPLGHPRPACPERDALSGQLRVAGGDGSPEPNRVRRAGTVGRE